MRESELVKACLDILKIKKIFSWRNNTGTFSTEYKGNKGFYRFGSPGSPDIICISNGQFIGIECKVGSNDLNVNQRLFKTACEKAGGVYWTIRTPEELLLKLQ